jgi:hypothetical protein
MPMRNVLTRRRPMAASACGAMLAPVDKDEP